MLTYGLITAPQVTETGPVLESVPFYRTLYSAEGNITENVMFAPTVSAGASEEFKPIPGNTAVYKLTGDGTHTVGFSHLFKKHPSSMEFNNTEDVVNLVTFMFDGVDFWYNLTTEPLGQWLELVGDFGYGEEIIVATGAACTIKDFLYHGLPRVRVTAFDLLTSVHYLGDDILTYQISIDGLVWNDNVDPRKCVLELDSNYAGVQTIYVRVTDGDETSLALEVPVTVQITHV